MTKEGVQNPMLQILMLLETPGILERAMREMPDEDRDIFTLRYYYAIPANASISFSRLS